MTAAESTPARLPGWLGPLTSSVDRAHEAFRDFAPPAGQGQPSAVLVLFGEGAQGPDLLFIERSATLRAHAGQPAFPGGRIESSDPGPQAAALREAQEETGLDPAGVDVFATLPVLWVPPTGFTVFPVLAWWREPVAVRAVDPAEVARVERIPISALAEPDNRLQLRHRSGNVGPAFDVSGLLIWGFTGRLVDELLRLGGWERPWDTSRVLPLPV